MSGFPQNQYFYIKSRSNGFVMDVYMGETTVDSNIIIWPQKETTAYDNDNQLWRSEDGFLINKKSNLVMDIRGGDLQSDKAIVQYDRKMTMAHNQRFGYRDGYIYCLADPRLVLDIRGGGSKEGTKIILYKRKDADNDNQQWELIPVPGQNQQHGQPDQQSQHSHGNVPYYPQPDHQQQQQQHHQHQQHGNVPYYPPPAGMGGYGPPDDQNPTYGRRD